MYTLLIIPVWIGAFALTILLIVKQVDRDNQKEWLVMVNKGLPPGVVLMCSDDGSFAVTYPHLDGSRGNILLKESSKLAAYKAAWKAFEWQVRLVNDPEFAKSIKKDPQWKPCE